MKVFLDFSEFLCYVVGMIKLNDVVRVKYGAHKGKTFQVVGFTRKDSLGKLITCRLYRSQYRFNFMPWQIEIHPFFAWLFLKTLLDYLYD